MHGCVSYIRESDTTIFFANPPTLARSADGANKDGTKVQVWDFVYEGSNRGFGYTKYGDNQ